MKTFNAGKLLALALALLLALGSGAAFAEGDKTATIAVTDTIGTLNPLLMDNTEIVKYATSLAFLPLVDLNRELEFAPQLAESITTDDNLTFTVKIKDEAVWSDGEPVTAQDVLFTFLCWSSPESGNTGLNMYAIEGIGDDGYTEPGATEISGISIVDEKTLTVTTKWPTALNTFLDNYGCYVLILPEHILRDVPKEQLLSYDWFNAPTVVSGPYFIADFDLNHYVHYTANENYFKGAPKIKNLNINVLDASSLPSGLKAGEIDLIQQTMGAILLEDYDYIKGLDNITTWQGTPVTNQSIFINVNNVPDKRIRQALLYGIDRQTILDGLVLGNGEIVDAFLCSASPYYDASLGVTEYDPDKAKELIAEAAKDGTPTTITWHVNSGDTTFVQAVSFIAAQFSDLGLTIDVKTVDLASLMIAADNQEIQVMSVQYTYAPVDPYTDVYWLLSDDGWTHYCNDEVLDALNESQALTDEAEITARYLLADQAVVEDCPMISAYILSNLGVTSNRLLNAVPDVYGTFLNVQEWDIAE